MQLLGKSALNDLDVFNFTKDFVFTAMDDLRKLVGGVVWESELLVDVFVIGLDTDEVGLLVQIVNVEVFLSLLARDPIEHDQVHGLDVESIGLDDRSGRDVLLVELHFIERAKHHGASLQEKRSLLEQFVELLCFVHKFIFIQSSEVERGRLIDELQF